MENFKTNKKYNLTIPINHVALEGILNIPQDASALVIFAHGSGSGRFSTRNQYVSNLLNDAKFATLLFDLLTLEEEEFDLRTRELRFDIDFLASRLMDITDWCIEHLKEYQFPIGYFGASTGAGAAIVSAAEKSVVRAIVSRGGRPDLAEKYLKKIHIPTLLIVGSHDEPVISLNQNAMSKMRCIKKLEIIPNATHLFEEPGTLEKVAQLSKEWFTEYLITK